MSRNPAAKVRVFAVWEPILITDWRAPGAGVLRRLTDSRATQIWDAKHLVAKRLAQDARDPQPKPGCCTRNGILWDLAAVYPPGATWTDAMPPAVLFDGAVVNMEADIETAVRTLQR